MKFISELERIYISTRVKRLDQISSLDSHKLQTQTPLELLQQRFEFNFWKWPPARTDV